MPQETVGFVNLEWTCKRCGSKNPGTTKICSSCGNVMSETDKFELPVQQELIKDEATIAKAERGPDVTCKYCGARNAADARPDAHDYDEAETRDRFIDLIHGVSYLPLMSNRNASPIGVSVRSNAPTTPNASEGRAARLPSAPTGTWAETSGPFALMPCQ